MKKIFLTTVGAAVVAGLLVGFGLMNQNKAVSQEMDMQQMMEKEMGRHIVSSSTITLGGWLDPKDFILLSDTTPYMSEGGHVALKVPCGDDGEQLLTVLAGVAPDVSPVKADYVEPLSNPPVSCVYHADIGKGITDIALANTSDERVRFHGSGGFTVTITVHGEISGEHEGPM